MHMEEIFMRNALLVAMAIVAFVAVGCGTPPPARNSPSSTPAPADDPTPTPEAVPPPPAPAPEPVVAITPQPAPQSGQAQMSGTGFAAGEAIGIRVGKTAEPDADLLVLANAVATEDGAFGPVTLSLPDDLQSGAHAIQAVGLTSGRQGTGTLWIRAPQPWLVLSSYDVPKYGDLGLVAGGFEPMDQVQVSLEPASGGSGDAVSLVSLAMDQAGNTAWAQVKLPRLAAGTYTMMLRGRASTAELRREFHVTLLKPVIELSPWAGPPGVPVQFNARGFAPGERVDASVGGSRDRIALQADGDGNLWGAGPVRIPQTASSGPLTLNLTGEDSGATATPEFKVLDPKPWLELTSWSGAPGAPVGFGGGRWIGDERVTIHIGNASSPVQAEGAADDNGWLKGVAQVYIPNDVDDEVIFVAVGDQSHLVAVATFKVVLPFGLRPGPTPPVPPARPAAAHSSVVQGRYRRAGRSGRGTFRRAR
jgi:hypothetical protein